MRAMHPDGKIRPGAQTRGDSQPGRQGRETTAGGDQQGAPDNKPEGERRRRPPAPGKAAKVADGETHKGKHEGMARKADTHGADRRAPQKSTGKLTLEKEGKKERQKERTGKKRAPDLDGQKARKTKGARGRQPR